MKPVDGHRPRHLHAEPLDGRLVVVDLFGQAAVQSSLRHRLGLQSLQAPRDAIKERLVALPRGTNGGDADLFLIVTSCQRKVPVNVGNTSILP